jgi:hypothetical protein
MTVPDGRAASGNIFPQLTLRGRTYTDLWFSSVDLRPRKVKGIIGMRFLARHEITLNFPKRMLYLKCTSTAPLAERTSASHNFCWNERADSVFASYFMAWTACRSASR